MNKRNDMSNNKFERLALVEQKKFMENFDPERSNREKRKLTRKIYNSSVTAQTKKQVTTYNDKGIHIGTGKDLCDCLSEDCTGCFLPCPRCRSFKCGHECRAGRRWMYDGYEVEGLEIKKINKIK